jgi:dipeptidase D
MKQPTMALTREQTSALGSSSGASLVWEAFYDLSQIPRMSKDERRALAFIQSLAEKCSLRRTSDAAGNLAVFRPGTGAGLGCDPVIVQAHVDMVCEANGKVKVRPILG